MKKIIPLLLVVAGISFFLGTAAVKQPDVQAIIQARQKKDKLITFKKHNAEKRLPNPTQSEIEDSLPELEDVALEPISNEKVHQMNRAPAVLPQTKEQRISALHEKFLREWEKRRAKLYKEMNLKPDQIKKLRAGRTKFYQDSDLSIVDLQAATINDDSENVISDIAYNNDPYDDYVRGIIGEDNFSVLEDALAQMNEQIQKKAPHRFVFVSAW